MQMKKSIFAKYWNWERLKRNDFVDERGKNIKIIDFGCWNENLKIFELAKIFYDELIFVGNISVINEEIKMHQENKPSILCLVHGTKIKMNDCPILDLKRYIPNKEKKDFFSQSKIEKIKNPEQLFLERLECFLEELKPVLETYKNDYEAVLFQKMAYAFGLKKNSCVFQEMAKDIGFSVVRKCSEKQEKLEALFYGKSGLLENEISDGQVTKWKREFLFLKQKYSLSNQFHQPLFSGIRPYNYPTIRLSQLANLYSKSHSLFSKIVQEEDSVSDVKNLLQSVSASCYWDCHFTFGKETSLKKSKKMSENFINLLLINVIFPFRWSYFRLLGKDISEEMILNYKSLPMEKNTYIDELKSLGIKINNAFDSQVYLFQYKKIKNEI